LPSPEAWSGIEYEEDLLLELQKIRKKQLATQVSKARIVGIAVPIFKNGKVIASLGIYLPETRYTPSLQERILEELKNAGELINKKLNENT